MHITKKFCGPISMLSPFQSFTKQIYFWNTEKPFDALLKITFFSRKSNFNRQALPGAIFFVF